MSGGMRDRMRETYFVSYGIVSFSIVVVEEIKFDKGI